MLRGKKYNWEIIDKLGEGDAGEVFLVKPSNEHTLAILKCPLQDPISYQRQAPQIEAEGMILRKLTNLSMSIMDFFIRTPKVLDQSIQDSLSSPDYFLVIEKAPGIDLNQIAKATRFGINKDLITNRLTESEKYFLNVLSKSKNLPRLLLLRAIYGIIIFLENTHNGVRDESNLDLTGIIWNDVKTDHVFWDIETKTITLIDWGNGRFLDKNKVSGDRLFSPRNDFEQLIAEIGRFLREFDQSLFSSLGWPQNISGNREIDLTDLKQKLFLKLSQETTELESLRKKEHEIISIPSLSFEDLDSLKTLQNIIIGFGELPDVTGFSAYCEKLAVEFIQKSNTSHFSKLCSVIKDYPFINYEKWELISRIITLCISDGKQGEKVSHIVESGLSDNWDDAIWLLRSLYIDEAEPIWWDEISLSIRSLIYGINSEILTPLQATRQLLRAVPKRQDITDALEQAINNWQELTPKHPFTDISYAGLDQILIYLDYDEPAKNQLMQSLIQPKAQIAIAFDALERKDFNTAQKALRKAFLWDVNRVSFINASYKIGVTNTWLNRIRNGPQDGERLETYILHVQSQVRDFISHVGHVSWLAAIDMALVELTKGTEPIELGNQIKGIDNEMPWIAKIARSKSQEKYLDSFEKALSNYYNCLREWRLIEAKELAESNLNKWSRAYIALIQAFRNAYRGSNFIDLNLYQFPKGDRNLTEAKEVLKVIYGWQNQLQSIGLIQTKASRYKSSYSTYSNWAIIYEFNRYFENWDNDILPFINEFNNKAWRYSRITTEISLASTSNRLQEVLFLINSSKSKWINSYRSQAVLHPMVLKEVADDLTKAHAIFQDWFRSGSTTDAEHRILCKAKEWEFIRNQLNDFVAQINSIILGREYWSIQNSRLYNKDEWIRAKSYLESINLLETALLGDQAYSNRWLEIFKIFEKHRKSPKLKKVKQTYELEKDHPLYNWLMASPGLSIRVSKVINLLLILFVIFLLFFICRGWWN